jgi:hypothetical protein
MISATSWRRRPFEHRSVECDMRKSLRPSRRHGVNSHGTRNVGRPSQATDEGPGPAPRRPHLNAAGPKPPLLNPQLLVRRLVDEDAATS